MTAEGTVGAPTFKGVVLVSNYYVHYVDHYLSKRL
jgi:hypothetical protein